MQILKVRIVLDHQEQVFRDVEIERSGTMENMHETVLAAFNITNDQMASFYESDENWNKGQEIALMDMGTNEEPVQLMSDTPLEEKMFDRARLLYVYDFMNLRIFYVEVIAVQEFDKEKEYPQIVMAYGKLPKIEDPFDLESLMADIEDESPKKHDPYADLDDDEPDDWSSDEEGMDNIDDYEGLI